jgi:NCAIR mutase (PurE)-related protein
MYEAVARRLPEARYDRVARMIALRRDETPQGGAGVTVVSAGAADSPVAEEAACTAEFYGSKVLRVYDVGVAGLHRLLDRIPQIRAANAVVAVAGMEGALASVVGGLVDKPVFAVPTSVGYGAGLSGLAALFAMLNSCSLGVSVMNIDNGFGAGYLASLIDRMVASAAPRADEM